MNTHDMNIEELTKQRDELLASCKAALKALTDNGRWLPDEYQEAARSCWKAISKSEGKNQ